MLIGIFEIGECNKLISFEMAQKIGLKIPKMLISSFQNELREFSTKNGSLIVKPIEDAYNCISGDYHESCSYGIFQLQKNLKNLDRVFPSVLQNCIDKKADIRVFYFFGEFYSKLIFSQNCDETKIDFRNYSEENPNRMMPCELPEKIQTKLSNLMSRLNLNSGSIDLILDVNDDFIFLEINPAGQFGMVSIPCNYHLEKRISKKLAYYE
jgi:glutathione synthase/RimK-type ligase-like ATP-grasp enzyme